MESARKILDALFKTISKLSDEEIDKIINKEAKLVYIETTKNYDKNTNIKANVKSDINIFDICNKLNSIKSREEGYKILKDKSIKKDILTKIAKDMDIHISKSYNKAKIIDRIVEGTIGIRIDRDAISNLDIK